MILWKGPVFDRPKPIQKLCCYSGLRMGVPNAVQIEIGPTRIQRNRSSRFPAAPGANGTNVHTGNVTPAGGSNVPATQNPSTSASSTQTNTADSTNTSGTQTSTENTSETQTQTPGRPRTTAFVMPGFPNGGLPGMPGIPGMPGMPRFQNMPHSNSLDPYLPCSSRHFFRPMSGIPRSRAGQPGQMEGELVSLLTFLSPCIGQANLRNFNDRNLKLGTKEEYIKH